MNDYYLVIQGKPAGPFSIAELRQKNINPDDFLKTEQMDDYKQAHEIEEIRTALHFNFIPTNPQYFGSFDQRLLASVIDWFIISGAFILLALINVFFFSNSENRLTITIGTLLGILPANFIYHIWFESSAEQATLGKQLLRIKVCDLNGQRISIHQALIRNLSKVFSLLPLFIGFLWIFFNKKQQCFHDIIAHTLVMKDRLI